MQNCLEKAMFLASESYSHTAYDLEFGCEEVMDVETPVSYAGDEYVFIEMAA